jgi:hypothetical protein
MRCPSTRRPLLHLRAELRYGSGGCSLSLSGRRLGGRLGHPVQRGRRRRSLRGGTRGRVTLGRVTPGYLFTSPPCERPAAFGLLTYPKA